MSELRFLTDDRDAPEDKQNELCIMPGGNGDWYVSVVPKGKGAIGRSVRISTSGGAQRSVPGLGVAIAQAYRAMRAVEPNPNNTCDCDDCKHKRACSCGRCPMCSGEFCFQCGGIEKCDHDIVDRHMARAKKPDTLEDFMAEHGLGAEDLERDI